MGNIDGEMDSKGNACVQTLTDTNSVSVLLNYGIIFPLSITTRVWKGPVSYTHLTLPTKRIV